MIIDLYKERVKKNLVEFPRKLNIGDVVKIHTWDERTSSAVVIGHTLDKSETRYNVRMFDRLDSFWPFNFEIYV